MSKPDNVVVQIDQAKFNWSVISKYDINAEEGIHFEWSQLLNKNIAKEDIELLINTIGFLYDKTTFVLNDRHKNRVSIMFKCNKCRDMKLKFKLSKVQQVDGELNMFKLIFFKSHLNHSFSCNRDGLNNRRMRMYLAESPLLIEMGKKLQCLPRKSNNVNHLLLLEKLCLGNAINRKCLNRAILDIGLKFDNQSTILYQMIVKYLETYQVHNPTSSTIVQADYDNQF